MTAAAAGRRAGPGAPGAAEAGRGGGEERRILVTPRSLTRDRPPELAPLTHWREALAICQAAGIPDLVGHHVGMFDFNTLSEAVLDAAIAANRSEVTWRKPRPDSRLELVQAKGRT
jgi:hypothetical protein